MKKLLYFALVPSAISQFLLAAPFRKDVPDDHKWNLSTMYASHQDWYNDLDGIITSKSAPYFPKVSVHKGKLARSKEALHETLTEYHKYLRKLEKLLVYAGLSHYEDMAEPRAKSLMSKAEQAYSVFAQETSWITPELFSLPEATFLEYISSPQLADFKVYLESILKQKAHARSSGEEEMLAQAMAVLRAPANAFMALQNTDIKFPTVLDSCGKEHDLTLSTSSKLLQSNDRTLRKNVSFTISAKYAEHENSLTELFAGNVKAHHFMAQARKYNSCLEAALSPNNIDVEVYHNLIAAVRCRVDLLHRYIKLKKELLGLDEVHNYDLSVPLIAPTTANYTYKEAQNLVLKAVKPLGVEYQAILKNGLTDAQWVDIYENTNKKSGAYSWGCYDSMPFMSLNFTGSLRDVFTLVHESGHSMHSFYSNSNQPYHYAGYSIFVAEVASLFNETLLRHMLLSQVDSDNERAYLLNQALEDIRGSFFNQVMYAEFELFAHTCYEQNIPLTPKLLNDKFNELTSYYFGPDFVVDPELSIRWSSVQHFFYNFYVYQYATGTSAALALADSVLKGDDGMRERYLNFLRAGCSEYPLDILAKAGCDMRTSAPVHKALDTFESYLNEFEQLVHTQRIEMNVAKVKVVQLKAENVTTKNVTTKNLISG